MAQHAAAVASQRLVSLVLMDTGLGAPREETCAVALAIAEAVRTEGLAAGWEVSRHAARANRVHVVDAEREA